MASIFFDLTRLVLSAGLRVPSGIARVELAYARFLLDRFPDEVRFVVTLPPRVQVVPARVVKRYIAATEAAWAGGISRDDAGVQRIAKFLGIPRSSFLAHQGAGTNNRSAWAQRILFSAAVLLHSTVQHLRPRLFARLLKPGEWNIYINVSGSGTDTRWICRWLAKNPSMRSVFLLHDIIPISHPEYVHPREPLRHARYVQQLTQSASVVLTNSNYTADCLRRYATEMGLNLPLIVNAPLGVESIFTNRICSSVPLPPYFVFLGAVEPRKNHMLILQVWQRLIDRLGDAAPKLVLLGRRGHGNENIFALIERSRSLKKHVMECNDLTDNLLAYLMANARATLLPSHVEGYGLPIAETLSLGTPLICSDLPPFREIAGDIPEFIDPLAGRGWHRMIADYCTPDGPRPSAQRERLKAFQPPVWARHFAILERIIATLDTPQPIAFDRLSPGETTPGIAHEMPVVLAAD